MKRSTYPYFQVTGLVTAHEHGEISPVAKIQAGGYVNFYDEIFGVLIRDAKWRFEKLGVSKERIAEFFFEGYETTSLVALDSIRVKRVDGERPEAFVDGFHNDKPIPKRETLIRQRRLVPLDQAGMIEIYSAKVYAIDPPAEVTA